MTRLGRWGGAMLGIAALALFVPRLGFDSSTLHADEVYYVPQARDVLRFGTEVDERRDFASALIVHPPAGKWPIALGIKVFGDEALGWRIFAALFGAAGVWLVSVIAMQLWHDRRVAWIAAGLVLLDGLWFAFSRIAMLDMFAAVWVLAALALTLGDARRPAGGSRWRIVLAGVAGGMAIATKWSAIPLVLVIAFSAIGWEEKRGRAAGGGSKRARSRAPALTAAALLLVPPLVYVASYVPWFADEQRAVPFQCEGRSVAGGWFCYQKTILDAQANVLSEKSSGFTHPYQAESWSWPWAGRPFAVYASYTDTEPRVPDAVVLGLPNVVGWPLGWVAIGAIAYGMARRRRQRDDASTLLVALFAAAFVPWLLADATGRRVYLFYALPLVPILALAVAGEVRRWLDDARARRVLIAAAAGVVAVAAYFFPVNAGLEIGPDGVGGVAGRTWVRADCGRGGDKRACWQVTADPAVTVPTDDQ